MAHTVCLVVMLVMLVTAAKILAVKAGTLFELACLLCWPCWPSCLVCGTGTLVLLKWMFYKLINMLWAIYTYIYLWIILPRSQLITQILLNQQPDSVTRWQHRSQICFATSEVKNHKITHNSTTTKDREKISTHLE